MDSEELFGSGLRALIVDDEGSVQTVLQMTLEDEGFETVVADGLESGRAAFAADSFDLAILDKNLGGGDETGLDLIPEFKAGGDCAVVMVTGFASVNSAMEAIKHGVDDYIAKPFDIEDFAARIRKVIEMQRLRRENVSLIEDLRRKNATLSNLAVRDSLTGLYNHAYLQDFLEKELTRSRRKRISFSLVLIDVDNFKDVNDTLGHPTGDKILRRIAEYISGDGRGSDVSFRLRTQDMAARYGGDEFALVLPDTEARGAAVKAERLRKQVEGLQLDAENDIQVTLSIGIAEFSRDANDRESLVVAADTALYAAKKGGRNQMVTFHPALIEGGRPSDEGADDALAELAALDNTIREGLFKFLYQPIVRGDSHQIYAYEVLCRPAHDAFRGPLDLFMAAERAGRIEELGESLRDVCLPILSELPQDRFLFVNLHPLEINNRLIDWAESFGPAAERVVLEVTETAAIGDHTRFREFLAALQGCGFRIALDDLGAGYAGLNSLALLRPDFAKLDRELLSDIKENDRRSRLIRHLLEFCTEEGMLVVGEGVETEEECRIVTDLGCHLLQGYYFAKPSPPFCEIEIGG